VRYGYIIIWIIDSRIPPHFGGYDFFDKLKDVDKKFEELMKVKTVSEIRVYHGRRKIREFYRAMNGR
jgi:hypothetical protein